MRHMRSRRILAMLLVLSMIFGLLTTTALADNGVDQNPSNVEESAANGTSEVGSGEGQPSGASEDESSTETNKEDVLPEEETTPEEKKTTSSEEVDTQEGVGENAVALSDYITVNNDETQYATLDEAIAAAAPTEGVITYTIYGEVHITSTDAWIQVAKADLTDLNEVKFVGMGSDAAIVIDNPQSVLADQKYDIDVSFTGLTLSHPNGQWVKDLGHATNYFTTCLRNTGAEGNTVTYTNCTFPNGACNNLYGKTVFDGCNFTNETSGSYNLWNYGGDTEVKNSTFTGVRGIKAYNEGTLEAAPTIKIENTSFEGLTEKAAVVASKATDITFESVTTTACTKGTFQKDIEGSSDEEKVTITANGTGISGSFNVTAEKNVEAAKEEFNISAGSFTGLSAEETETLKAYLAPNAKISEDGTVSSGATPATGAATVGSNTYPTLKEAFEAANNNDSIIINAGIYEMSDLSYLSGKTVTVSAQTDAEVTFDNAGAVNLGSANVTFQNIIFDYMPNQNYTGLQHAGDLTYEGCTFNGMVFLYGNSETFNTCTFNQTSADAYNVWTYGAKNVAFNSCTFNCVGKSVLVYNEGANAKTDLNVNDTKFNASAPVKGKAAIEIDTSLMTEGATITVDANTTAHGFAAGSNSGSTLWNDKNQTADTNKNTTVTVANETVFAPKSTGVAKGTEANPYTLDELGAMTRDAYIAAQKELGGTMYVTVGDYSYPDHGVLGNGKRDDTTGQTEDRSVLNGYNSNGYLDDKNDGANGKSIVFVNGSITSGVTGYETIDGITKITSLLLAVPAYTNVTFKGITFTNVMCFDYQLYTSPWSQLGELKFDGCKFNGIIIGSIAAQTLTFNGCTFENFKNTTKANNSNPTWIRPAYGNWTESDNDVQGQNFKSLTKINFTNNTVTSTRPVKFEYISQWNNTTTLTATGNSFDISAQEGDVETKNVGLYIGPHKDKNAVNLVLDNNTKTGDTAALYVIPSGMSKLPVGSTVTDLSGKQIEITDDALEWKTDTKVTLKTEPVPAVKNVAKVGETEYATLEDAIAKADAGQTVTLIADVNTPETTYVVSKNLTIDLNGKTVTGYGYDGVFQIDGANAKVLIKNGNVVAVEKTGSEGKYAMAVWACAENCEVTLEDLTVTQDITHTDDKQMDMIYTSNGTIIIDSGFFESGTPAWTLNCNDSAYKNGKAKITVNGGTFVGFDPNVSPEQKDENGNVPSFAAPGVGVDNVDGTFTAVKDMTAQLLDASGNSVKAYDSLAEAIAAAAAGQTVRLLADATENIEIATDKNITLDLNGHTINGGTGTAVATIKNCGTVTITDSSAAKTGTIKRDDQGVKDETSYYVIRNIGTMTIEQAIVTNNSGYAKPNPSGSMVGSSLICNGDDDLGGTLNISGGKFEQKNFIAIKNGALGKLNVTGGTISSDHSAIQNWFEATITGGEINGQLWTDAYKEGESVGHTTIGGSAKYTGEIVMDIYGNVPPTLEITGGKLDVTNWRVTPAAAKAGAKPAVSGGTFSSAVAPEYCAEGFEPKDNGDGTFGVKEISAAKIGNIEYETLAAAFAEAKDGDTIVLLKDSSGDGIVVKQSTFTDKGLIVDFNNHSYTVGGVLVGSSGTVSNGFQLNKDNKITFKNGALYGDASVAGDTTTVWQGAPAIMIQNYSNLTLDGMTVVGGKETCYTISNNCGDTLIKNSTITAGEASTKPAYQPARAFDVCGFSTYPGATVTVENSTINGAVEISNGNNSKVALTIGKGTTVSGSLVDGGNGDKVAVTKDKSVSVAAPDGYKWVDGENGQTLAKIVMVAEVNGKQYETLQAALDAAGRKQTVKLIADTTENVTMGTPYLTLDLNGHTLNGSTGERKPALAVTARVTVKDSSAKQNGTIKREDTPKNSGVSSHYVIDIQGDGWLTFESGNVINNSGTKEGKGASLVRVGDDSVAKHPGLNIKGGNFKQDNFIAIKVDRGTFYLNGGTITSENSYAIENWWYATIKGGTVSGTVSSWVYSGGKAFSELEISGGTIDGDVASVSYDNAVGKTAKVTISGGKVTGTLGTYTYNNGLDPIEEPAKATIGVTGGTFTKNPTKYVVEDSTVKVNDDGTFGVEKAYLAKVGDTSYYTMDEAFQAAVTSGETLNLLRDYTTNAVQNSGSKSFTIDLNGHTWTYTGTNTNCAAFEINYPNVTLTVKNGKVVSNSMVGLIPSAMGGTITYDNSGLVFENVQATAKGNSGIETNGNNTNDTITLKNSTLNVPNGFGIYFPSSGTLTIDNSKITANTLGVQVCSGSLDIKGAGTKIEVTGDGVEKTENDGAIQDGAAISIVNRTGYKGLEKITVTEGTFKAKKGNDAVKAYNWKDKTESNFTEPGKVAISGGSYSTVVPADLCAEGFVPVTKANEAGLYEVTKDTSEAKIGDTKYATLADALKVATSGNTIVLLNDVTHATGFVLNDGILIDLNGHNLTTPFIFTSIEGGAGVVDTSNTKSNGGIGTLKVQFKKSVMNCITVSGIANGNYLPVYAGAETTAEGTTWHSYKIYRAAVVTQTPSTAEDKVSFSFRVVFADKAAYTVMKNNPDQFIIRLDLVLKNADSETAGSSANTYFVFNQSYVNSWISAEGGLFTVHFTGVSGYSGSVLNATASAKSAYTGAALDSQQMNVTIQ